MVYQPATEIFRAYDIRGIVPTTLNEETAYVVGLALGSLAVEQQQPTINIGYDHRLSSPELCHALCKGIRETGTNIIDIGQVATPVLYFSTYFLNTLSGVMITGSHCTPEYNGFKMMMAGKAIADEAIQELLQRIQQQQFHKGTALGTYTKQDITQAYLEAITSRIAPLKHKRKVVVDAGHGMMSEIAPRLLAALNCDVIPLYCDIDPNFPDHHPDPSQPENLQDLIRAVKTHQADLGLAFDGDGDRIGVITSAGKIIWPDRLLAVYARDALTSVPNGTIIYDVKCTRHLKNYIAQQGGNPLLWKTGHSHIKTKMKEAKAIVAGEMSGHIFFGQNWYGFDDALYAAAKLVEILGAQELTSDAFFALIPDSLNTPELKIAMPEDKKFSFIEKFIQHAHFINGEKITIDGLRVEYPDGFGLLRASNTSPYLVLRFEGDSEASLNRIRDEFKKNLLEVDSSLQLSF